MRKYCIATILAVLTIVALTGVAPAQESPTPANPPNEATPGGGGGGAQNRFENLSKQLNLTEEQREKLRPVLKREAERIRDVRQNSSLTHGQARRRVAMIRKETNQHIAQILTPEQNRQWQEIREERRAANQGGQGRAGGGAGGPGGRQSAPNPDNGPASPPPSAQPQP